MSKSAIIAILSGVALGMSHVKITDWQFPAVFFCVMLAGLYERHQNKQEGTNQ